MSTLYPELIEEDDEANFSNNLFKNLFVHRK